MQDRERESEIRSSPPAGEPAPAPASGEGLVAEGDMDADEGEPNSAPSPVEQTAASRNSNQVSSQLQSRLEKEIACKQSDNGQFKVQISCSSPSPPSFLAGVDEPPPKSRPPKSRPPLRANRHQKSDKQLKHTGRHASSQANTQGGTRNHVASRAQAQQAQQPRCRPPARDRCG